MLLLPPVLLTGGWSCPALSDPYDRIGGSGEGGRGAGGSKQGYEVGSGEGWETRLSVSASTGASASVYAMLC